MLDSERAERLVREMARAIQARGLTVPALLLGEACRPLTFLASQWLHAFGPFVAGALNLAMPGLDENRVAEYAYLLENRSNLDALLDRLEETANAGG
ncbi:MAG: hypothetical protein RDU89_03735 [bacterium]|nr:hypothetical protein [bacterium]